MNKCTKCGRALVTGFYCTCNDRPNNIKYGIFIPGIDQAMETYDDMNEAYAAAQYAAEETDVFHEVKEVKQ